jgi:hypothetical protein
MPAAVSRTGRPSFPSSFVPFVLRRGRRLPAPDRPRPGPGPAPGVARYAAPAWSRARRSSSPTAPLGPVGCCQESVAPAVPQGRPSAGPVAAVWRLPAEVVRVAPGAAPVACRPVPSWAAVRGVGRGSRALGTPERCASPRGKRAADERCAAKYPGLVDDAGEAVLGQRCRHLASRSVSRGRADLLWPDPPARGVHLLRDRASGLRSTREPAPATWWGHRMREPEGSEAGPTASRELRVSSLSCLAARAGHRPVASGPLVGGPRAGLPRSVAPFARGAAGSPRR